MQLKQIVNNYIKFAYFLVGISTAVLYLHRVAPSFEVMHRGVSWVCTFVTPVDLLDSILIGPKCLTLLSWLNIPEDTSLLFSI